MKKESTKLLGVGLTIALLTSLIVAAAPVSAISQPSVVVTPNTISDTANYTILFELYNELGYGDTITITFPSDTSLSAINATIAASPGWIGGSWKNATLVSSNWTNNATLGTVTYTLDPGDEVGQSAQVQINISGGIINPSIPGIYTLAVHTSQETTPSQSDAYLIQHGWVSSADATNIGTNSATLNGNLDNLGGHTTINASFVWGITSGGPYPNETSPQAMTSTGLFSANISGLSPSTTYYFVAKATDDITDYGTELDFKTRSSPSVSVTPDIISVTANYTILFEIHNELGSGDTITVTYPSDTSLGAISATIAASPGWIGGLWKNATLTSSNWSYNATLRTVAYTLNPGDEVGKSAQVQIKITGGVTNPSIPGIYMLTVHTSQETTPLQSEAYLVQVPIVPNLEATIDINPDTLNLKSKGKWVSAYIELPEGFDVNDIDISTVLLNGCVMARSKPVGIGDYDNDTIPDLMVKFDRRLVQDILNVGKEVEVNIRGEINGILFEGIDTIRVIE